jgi:hypothetical protein
MAALTEEVKTFIVQAHACFRKPSLIKRDVKAEFGLDLKRELIQFYHPEKGSKEKRLAKKWAAIFEKTRAAFIEGKVTTGIALQSYRIGLYQRAADFYEEQGNMVLASEMAEKAAKEQGGAYTNKRELTGQGGQPLIPTNVEANIMKAYGGGDDPGK